MPQNQQENNSDTVAREAYERVTNDLKQAKDKVEELSTTVKDLHLVGKARSWFKAQEADDPDGWAELALPHIREQEDIEEVLAAKFADRIKLSASEEAEQGEEAEEEAPPAPPQPGFVRGPNPGAQGTDPEMPTLTYNSPEVKKAIQANDKATLYQWMKEGRLKFSPLNESAKTSQER